VQDDDYDDDDDDDDENHAMHLGGHHPSQGGHGPLGPPLGDAPGKATGEHRVN
jgi:hypothetical protein